MQWADENIRKDICRPIQLLSRANTQIESSKARSIHKGEGRDAFKMSLILFDDIQ